MATLEQANQDLSWQVAMLAKGADSRPSSSPHKGPRETVINLPLLGPGTHGLQSLAACGTCTAWPRLSPMAVGSWTSVRSKTGTSVLSRPGALLRMSNDNMRDASSRMGSHAVNQAS